jgi:CRISPR/Cas system-associated exonuclease Cas4 (RecB family)
MALVIDGDTASPPSPSQRQRPPNLLAQQITGRAYVSYSQLSLMRSCPRKFAFQYVEKAQPEFQPCSLIFGGAIHSALEFYFRAKLEGLGVTHEALVSAFHDAWKRQREQGGNGVPVRFNKGADIDSVHAMADRMLRAFQTTALASPKGKILGIEEQLQVVLHPDLPDLLAKVDLVTQTDGALHVIDFKTSRSRWSQTKALESAEQPQLYAATVARMARVLGVPVKLHFAVITKAKKPIVQILPVPTNANTLTVLKETAVQTWAAIKTGNFYPNPSPMTCTTCPFKSRCPIFKGR